MKYIIPAVKTSVVRDTGPAKGKSRLLQQVRYAICRKHYSIRTEEAYDIRTMRKLLDYNDVHTSMIRTHVIDANIRSVISPADM